MFHKFPILVCVFGLILTNSVGVGQTAYVEKKAKKFFSADLSYQNTSGPRTISVRNSVSANMNDPALGVVIGSSDYDFGWNSGFPRRMVMYSPHEAHMIFTEQNRSLSAPNNRAAIKYVYYNIKTGVVKSGYPRERSVGASAGGSIDVFRMGDAAGYAVILYTLGSDIRIAIDNLAGYGSFFEQKLPANLSHNVTNPQVAIDQLAQTIWMSGMKNHNDIILGSSTDFGTTWTVVDSVMRHLPVKGFSLSSAESPLIFSATGAMYLVVSLKGSGSIPPIGTAHPDSADRIGYFVSTNKGKSWNWKTLIVDGHRFIAGLDTVYVLGENFSQFSAAVDHRERVHVLLNAYSVKPIDQQRLSNYFFVLYNRTGMIDWTSVTPYSVAHVPEYDSSSYVYPGNAIGFPYPGLSIDADRDFVYAVWSQPILNPDKTLQRKNGFVQYELYYTQNLTGAHKIASSFGGLFVNSASRLTYDGTQQYINFIYLADTVSGSSIFSDENPVQVPWKFRRIAGYQDYPMYIFISATADTGGNIQPSGLIKVPASSSKKFTIAAIPGYVVDSVTVDGTSVGAVTEYTMTEIYHDKKIHVYTSKTSMAVDRDGSLLPAEYLLSQNYPNPFNPSTTIRYEIPSRSAVTLTVFDALGRELQQLVKGEQDAGRYSVEWSAASMPSGVYFYRISAGNFVQSKRMVLLK